MIGFRFTQPPSSLKWSKIQAKLYYVVLKKNWTTTLQQGSKPPLYWLAVLFTCISPVCEFGDDIHLIVTVTVKGFILPQCYCMKTQHRPNRMQIDIPTTNDRPSRTESMLATAWAIRKIAPLVLLMTLTRTMWCMQLEQRGTGTETP
jgi:hypothetical protein